MMDNARSIEEEVEVNMYMRMRMPRSIRKITNMPILLLFVYFFFSELLTIINVTPI